MNEQVVVAPGEEKTSDRIYLEDVRNNALVRIASDTRLTPQQKQSAVAELDFLLDCERIRRARQLSWQLQNERDEQTYTQFCRRQQIAIYLREQQAESALKLMRLRRDSIRCRVETVVELRRLAPKLAEDEDADLKRQARRELLRLRLQDQVALERERMATQRVRERTFKRDEFRQIVRQRYPEREEELMDDYDRFVNERMEREAL